MVDMAERKRTRGSGRPKRTGLPLHVYLPPAVRKALDDYLASADPRPSQTAVVALALRRYLEGVGFWPPPGDES
jgi:hypothetical protein